MTNLTELVAVADRTANALTLVLLLIATVTLLVSGIGIMNIMLATVSARIREIGIRKAIGATNREFAFSPVGGDTDFSGRRFCRSRHRTGASFFGALPYRVPHPDLGTVGNRGHCGFVAGGYFWYRSGGAGGEAGSGGELEARVKQSAFSRQLCNSDPLWPGPIGVSNVCSFLCPLEPAFQKADLGLTGADAEAESSKTATPGWLARRSSCSPFGNGLVLRSPYTSYEATAYPSPLHHHRQTSSSFCSTGIEQPDV